MSRWRCSETQHTKWDVTHTAILFYLYCIGRHWRKYAKMCSPAALWGLVTLQAHGGGCVIFTLSSKGVSKASTTPSTAQPTSPTFFPKARETADNYLVWNFLTASVSSTQYVGVTELIFDCGSEDMQQDLCWCVYWRCHPKSKGVIPKIMVFIFDDLPLK